MSGKRQIAEALDALPESLTVEEALERLIRAFKLKQAMTGGQLTTPTAAGPEGERSPILRLIEEERLDEARELAASTAASEWQRLLAPAAVTVADRAGGHGITDQADAARAVLPEYSGQWVVLREGRVIASGPKYGELYRGVQSQGLIDGAVFLKVEG